MNSSAADKIRDLFQLTLSELETNIVSQAIKFSQSPQRLAEELQQSVADYKSRFFESLCQLLQFISHLCGSNGAEVLKIAQDLDSQVTRLKQQQLLIQMKAVLTQKVKALIETYNGTRKGEIEAQLKLLTDSLSKIENTLMDSSMPTQYITPYPKQLSSISKDQLTPNLSIQNFFITPEQRQFERQTYSHNPSSQEVIDKTLNSFSHEAQQNVIEFDQSPTFQQKIFTNEIMEQYLYSTQIEQTTTRIDNPKSERKQSTQSLKQISPSPNQKRLINTSKTKEPVSRSTSSLDQVNLINSLNQADDRKRNKENLAPQKKKSMQIQKPKTLVIPKVQKKK